MAAHGKKNVLVHFSYFHCLFLLLAIPRPSLGSLYACPLSNENIMLSQYSPKEIMIHAKGGMINLNVWSVECDFLFHTSFSQREIKNIQVIEQGDTGKMWARLAIEVNSSSVLIYKTLGLNSEFYTLGKIQPARIIPLDTLCSAEDLRLDVSKSADVAIACPTPPPDPLYTSNASYYLIPFIAFLCVFAVWYRWCRPECQTCWGKVKKSPKLILPPRLQIPVSHSTVVAVPPSIPPYSNNTSNTISSTANITNISAPNNSNLQTANSKPSTAINSNAPTSTSDVPILPSTPVPSSTVLHEPVPPSLPKNANKEKSPLLPLFQNQFGFKRLQE